MPQHALSPSTRVLLDEEALGRTLSRIAHEVIERNEDLASVALVGIWSRGVPLARRLHNLIEERSGEDIELGQLDITFHRDDVHVHAGRPPRRPQPVVRDTKLDFDLEGRTVILVDDVLYTGRTIRAAIDALFAFGGRRASSSRFSPTAATASCRSGPTTWARTCRRHAVSASRSSCSRSTRSTACCLSPSVRRREHERVAGRRR